jgi:hypothetical protein
VIASSSLRTSRLRRAWARGWALCLALIAAIAIHCGLCAADAADGTARRSVSYVADEADDAAERATGHSAPAPRPAQGVGQGRDPQHHHPLHGPALPPRPAKKRAPVEVLIGCLALLLLLAPPGPGGGTARAGRAPGTAQSRLLTRICVSRS